MRFSRLASLFVCALAALGATPAFAAPPVEAFGALEYFEGPALSPDGKYYAAVRQTPDQDVVAIYQVGSTAKPQGLPMGVNDVVGIEWLNNDRLVISLRFVEKMGNYEYYNIARSLSVGRDGSNPFIFFRSDRFKWNTFSGSIFARLPGDAQHVLMGAWDTDSVNIYRVDVNDGAMLTVGQGNKQTYGWLTDLNGEVRFRWDGSARYKEGEVFVRTAGSEQWTSFMKLDLNAGSLNEGVDPVAFTSDPNIIYATAYEGKGTQTLVRYDIVGRRVVEIVSRDPNYDFGGFITDPWDNRPVGYYRITDSPVVTYFDPVWKRAQEAANAAVRGGGRNGIVSASTDGSRIIVRNSGPQNPPVYYLVDVAARTSTEIGREYPNLKPSDLGEMMPYVYQATDGTRIPGYITYPPGGARTNLPLVVFPHGGPESRDYLSFDWWAQFMASRGYAVFQPNFRGSDGYGRAWAEAGYNQWGKLMQQDVTDGVRKLIADGIADPKRICIVGASYGGYAALAGATVTPDLYACAVSVNGVSDLGDMLSHAKSKWGRYSGSLDYWKLSIGSLSDDVSPVDRAASVTAPVLLIHGSEDPIVPFDQSSDMESALESAGKTVELIELEGEDHFLAKAPTRLRTLKEIERFLAAHLGG